MTIDEEAVLIDLKDTLEQCGVTEDWVDTMWWNSDDDKTDKLFLRNNEGRVFALTAKETQ